jgi:hypothetical protein
MTSPPQFAQIAMTGDSAQNRYRRFYGIVTVWNCGKDNKKGWMAAKTLRIGPCNA